MSFEFVPVVSTAAAVNKVLGRIRAAEIPEDIVFVAVSYVRLL